MGSGFSCKTKGKSEAEILLYEDVGAGFFGGVTAKDFAKELAGLGSVETIHLRIASLGGDAHEGLAIYRRLADHPARIVTHIDSWAASIASVIAMAGDEIHIAEAGAIMIHEAWTVAMGDAASLRSIADRLEASSAAIADVYVARTGKPLSQVRDWMAAETWFYGQEAVDAGFANSVVENMKVAARFNPDLHKFRNAPAALAGTPNRDAMRQRLAEMRAKFARDRKAA